jgi:hypothetical protein
LLWVVVATCGQLSHASSTPSPSSSCPIGTHTAASITRASTGRASTIRASIGAASISAASITAASISAASPPPSTVAASGTQVPARLPAPAPYSWHVAPAKLQ